MTRKKIGFIVNRTRPVAVHKCKAFDKLNPRVLHAIPRGFFFQGEVWYVWGEGDVSVRVEFCPFCGKDLAAMIPTFPESKGPQWKLRDARPPKAKRRPRKGAANE